MGHWRCSASWGGSTESFGEMNTVLITGAGGFIGGWVVREFLAQGWRVLAVVHRHVPAWLHEQEAAGRLRLITADLGDASQVAALTTTPAGPERVAAVVHCAGRASDVGWDREFRRANLDAVRHLGRQALAEQVPRFVFLSTTDVYGLHDFHGEDEETLPLGAFPRNPYPRYKIEAERWIREAMAPGSYVILRLAQVWGVGDTTLTQRIVGFLRGSPWIVHFGKWGGANRWPLAHVRNVAAACYLAATAAPAAGRAIHVLDDERTTMDEWYRRVAEIYLPGKQFRTVTLPMAFGAALGLPVEWMSSALNLAHPFVDPSYYALHAVSANLDFSNTRLCNLFAYAGRRLVTRAEGLDELRAATQLHGNRPRDAVS
jgi:nucleoside-diphosphate-sugar epimerase